MNNKSDTFSNEELLELKKELRSSYFTALAGFLIVMVVLHLLIYIRFDSFEKLQFEILVITGTMIFTFFVTKHSTRQLRSEIRDGRKIIVFKKIEEKSDFMDKQDRFSPEFKKYVILASGQKYVVTEEQY